MANVSTRPQKGATTVPKTATAVTASKADTAAAPIESEAPQSTTERAAVASVTVSPSLMVLMIKSKDGYFTANRITAAQDAGFKWTRRGHNELGLLSLDTEEPIAVMRTAGGLEAIGKLTTIELHIDPERCPIEWQAGTTFMDAAVRFAERMLGTLCDGLGQPLESESIAALAGYIDGVMLRRQKESEPPRVKQQDGSMRAPGLLSFTGTYFTPRGAYIKNCRFECQPSTYYLGNIDGIKMAREMLDYMATHKQASSMLSLKNILEDAFESVLNEQRHHNKPSREHVLRGFMDVIQAMVVFAARNANYSAYVDSRIADQQQQAETWENYKQKDRAEFVDRMRAAKAAKKAQRKGCAS